MPVLRGCVQGVHSACSLLLGRHQMLRPPQAWSAFPSGKATVLLPGAELQFQRTSRDSSPLPGIYETRPCGSSGPGWGAPLSL